MSRFLFCMTLLLSGSLIFGQSLTGKLADGTAVFSNLERGLILCGASTPEALAQSAAAFEAFLKKVELSKKQRSLPQARQLMALIKNFGRVLKTETPEASLEDAMDKGKYNPVIASFLMEEVASRMGLAEQVWPEDPRPAAPHFAKSSPKRANVLAAVLALLAAERVFESNPDQCVKMLRFSTNLDPDFTYEGERMSREWYNRIYRLYTEENWVLGGRLAAPAAARFPSRQEFPPLCFNFAILISQKDDMSLEARRSMMEALAPYTGEHRETLEQTIDDLAYNQAVRRYKSGAYREAWALAKDLQHSNQEALTQLQAAILENLIAQTENDAEKADFQKALNQVDPQAARHIQIRMDQMAVKAEFDEGDYENALKIAAQQLDSPNGKENYLAVLTHWIDALNGSGKFKESLRRLDSISSNNVPPKTIAAMRYNTYLNWLNRVTDLNKQIPIYLEMKTDGKLAMNEEEQQSLMENWANAYHLLIEDLIAKREFSQAQTWSKKAIAAFPGHEALENQSELIKTIMARLKENR